MALWCQTDLEHLGDWCRRIRKSRGVTLEQLEPRCKVRHTTIARFEAGGTTTAKTFQGYLEGLKSPDVVYPPKEVLNDKQARLLRAHFDQHGQLADKTAALTKLRFELITSRKYASQFKGILDQLRAQPWPAYIRDDLWHIYAFNGSVLHLFDLLSAEERKKSLSAWAAWHVVAVKFVADSAFRRKHLHPQIYFPPAVATFFEDERTNSLLFTPQMRILVCRLHELSKENNLDFQALWDDAVTFTHRFQAGDLLRILEHEGRRFQTEVLQDPEGETWVEVDSASLRFTLMVWVPKDPEAEAVFREIKETHKDSQEVFYAADFDTKPKSFHVNTWKNVQERVDQLVQEKEQQSLQRRKG